MSFSKCNSALVCSDNKRGKEASSKCLLLSVTTALPSCLWNLHVHDPGKLLTVSPASFHFRAKLRSYLPSTVMHLVLSSVLKTLSTMNPRRTSSPMMVIQNELVLTAAKRQTRLRAHNLLTYKEGRSA